MKEYQYNGSDFSLYLFKKKKNNNKNKEEKKRLHFLKYKVA